MPYENKLGSILSQLNIGDCVICRSYQEDLTEPGLALSSRVYRGRLAEQHLRDGHDTRIRAECAACQSLQTALIQTTSRGASARGEWVTILNWAERHWNEDHLEGRQDTADRINRGENCYEEGRTTPLLVPIFKESTRSVLDRLLDDDEL